MRDFYEGLLPFRRFFYVFLSVENSYRSFMRSFTSSIVVDTFCEEGEHLSYLLARISRIIVLAIHSIINDMTFPLSY